MRRRSRCTASFAAFRVAATTIIRNMSRDVSIVLVLRRSRRLVAVAAMAPAVAAASALAFTSKRADAGKEPPAHIATSRQTDVNRSASFLPPATAAPVVPVPRLIRVRHWSLHRRHCLLQAVALHTGSEGAVTKDPLALTSTSVLAMMLTPLMTPSQHRNQLQPRPHLRTRTISSSRFC